MRLGTPYFDGFIPFGSQADVLSFLYNHNYSLYTPEILMSGSVGSSKSITAAHWGTSHSLRWPGARTGIVRMGLPDIKRTIYKEIIEHFGESIIQGMHYEKHDTTAQITFANGSEIIAISFGDKNYGKVKSYKLSGLIIEEATEMPDEFYEPGGGFMLLKGRLRRIHNVPENWLLAATNPGEPEGPLYDYFFKSNIESRRVFYSLTKDNPYLDPVYIKQLSQDYSPLEAERYLRGKWISLFGKGIYHSYSDENSVKAKFEPKDHIPINVCFDFNAASNKPMSAMIFQYYEDKYHCFAESIIDNSLWCLDCLEDFEAKGHLKKHQEIYIHGDATGNAKSANSQYTNYELIEQWLTSRGYTFKISVPAANPPITTRHTKVNALCKNDNGQIKLFVYSGCRTLKQGLKLTKFKPKTRIEDDSKRYQHVTTALGYGLYAWEKIKNKKTSSSYTRTGNHDQHLRKRKHRLSKQYNN